MDTLLLDGETLSLENVREVAGDRRRVALHPEAARKMSTSRTVVEAIVNDGRIVYGISTGFGKLSDVHIGHEQLTTLQDNLVLNRYMTAPFARRGVRNDAAIEAEAKEDIARFDVRAPSAAVTAGTLSGGNQQKLVVAREFDRDLKLLVLDQPTRGLDVGSIEFIHRQIINKRDAGTALQPTVEFTRGHPQRAMLLAHCLWRRTAAAGGAAGRIGSNAPWPNWRAPVGRTQSTAARVRPTRARLRSPTRPERSSRPALKCAP